MKGNVLIAQSGGPTAVINASCAGIIQEAFQHKKEIDGVYGAVNGILGVLKEELLDLNQEDPATIELLKRTPSSALGSCRYKLSDKDYDRVLSVLKAHHIRYAFFIGGNDTMDTANKVNQLAQQAGWELRVIGVPKTVDNDLVGTDHCPGYPSVARWLAIAVRDAGLDTKAIYCADPVKIIETMGRDSGWITAATALARERPDDPPHLIYLPERPFVREKFIADVKRVYEKVGYVLMAVCEGLRDAEGKLLSESKAKVDVDGFGHAQLGGVADLLSSMIKTDLGIKARFDKPGTIQRVAMSGASEVDIAEAYEAGRLAVDKAVRGESGYMISLERMPGKKYQCTMGMVALGKVANARRTVPDEFINKDGNDVTPAFVDWLRPLLKPGLSQYAHLKRVLVGKKVE